MKMQSMACFRPRNNKSVNKILIKDFKLLKASQSYTPDPNLLFK